MVSGDGTGREQVTVDDTSGEATTPVARGAEVAPGVVLDPETRQPMEAPEGATAPPSAPPDMLGASSDTEEREGADDKPPR